MRISGAAGSILMAERVALNFAGRLSGIATQTAAFVAETAGTQARITCTRKTTPGLRMVEKLAVLGAPEFGFIQQQAGMFSYSGLSKAQVDRLREEYAIYAIGTGRICVAALSQNNLDKVAEAVYAVSRG